MEIFVEQLIKTGDSSSLVPRSVGMTQLGEKSAKHVILNGVVTVSETN